MSDSKPAPLADFSLPDPARFAQNLAKLAEQAAVLAQTLSSHPEASKEEAETQIIPIAQVSKTLGDVWQAQMADPKRFMEAQNHLWAQYTEVWNRSWAKAMGMHVDPVVEPSKSDKRFKDKDWVENSVYDFIKQIYLLSTRWALNLVETAEGLDPHTKQKARFYVENIANALSPSNSVLLNPQVLRTTLATSGENLLRGMEKFQKDLSQVQGRLRISQVDGTAFKLGENIATTPGKVVFRNDLFVMRQRHQRNRARRRKNPVGQSAHRDYRWCRYTHQPYRHRCACRFKDDARERRQCRRCALPFRPAPHEIGARRGCRNFYSRRIRVR